MNVEAQRNPTSGLGLMVLLSVFVACVGLLILGGCVPPPSAPLGPVGGGTPSSGGGGGADTGGGIDGDDADGDEDGGDDADGGDSEDGDADTTDPGAALRRVMDASQGAGDIEAAANGYEKAILDLYLADPEHASEQLREMIASQLTSPEDVEQFVDMQHALAGRTVWVSAGLRGDAAKTRRDRMQADDVSRVVAVYVNGINATFDGADLDTLMLANLLTRGPDLVEELTGVVLHYNLSSTDEERSFWDGVICPAAQFSFDLDQDMCTDWGWGVDFVEAMADKMVELIGNPNIGIDHREIADRVTRHLQEGLGVLLIGHSQGNFKIDRALNLLWDNDGNWADDAQSAHDALRAHVAVVAVGCPATYEETIDRGIRVRKINIRHSQSLAGTDWNLHIEWLRLPEVRITEDIVALLDETQPESEWLPNRWENLYMTEVHSLRDTYIRLYGVNIREAVREVAEAITEGDTCAYLCDSLPGWPTGDGLDVYLDFNGAKSQAFLESRNIISGPFVTQPFSMAALEQPPSMTDKNAAEKIQNYVEGLFADHNICFHSSYSHEEPQATHVIVYIGGAGEVESGDNAKAESIGMAEERDHIAVVCPPNIRPEVDSDDIDDTLWAIATRIAHELGHLLGLRHTKTDHDIMSGIFVYSTSRDAQFQPTTIDEGGFEYDGQEQNAPCILECRLGPVAERSCSRNELSEDDDDVLAFDLGGGVTMELVRIPAGTFMMGTDNAVYYPEYQRPVHSVTIDQPFYLGRYEVTQAQWEAVIGSNPSGFSGSDDLPVERVGWEEAVELTQALSRLVGREARLPTEAEWEYACRAGTTTEYSFGDSAGDLGQYAWYDANSSSRSHQVGQKQPNAFGLYDMHGNVWEWCEDVWHEDYSGAPSDGGAWTSGGVSSKRIIRGGSWLNDGGYLTSTSRLGGALIDHDPYIGLRVVVQP